MDTYHGDTLAFRDRKFLLDEQPLEAYFQLIGQRPHLHDGACPPCRCYAATWEIDDGWLYLVGLAGQWPDNSPVMLRNLFPFAGERILATWFNGTLHGLRQDDGHSPGVAADRRRYPDLVLTIEHGRMHGSSIVHRSPAGSAADSPAAAASVPGRGELASAGDDSSLMI